MEKYHKFAFERKKILVSIIKEKDIIGLNDYMLNGKLLFNVECRSSKGQYFSIDTKVTIINN